MMTDSNGRRHRITLPGMTNTVAWERQMEIARDSLPPQFAEIVCKADRPFVQKTADVINPRNEFLDGRVVLIGDALAGFRPHTVVRTAQAAFDAVVYADFVAGRLGKGEWKGKTMGYARLMQGMGVRMGERSQVSGLGVEEMVRDRDEASEVVTEEMILQWATGVT